MRDRMSRVSSKQDFDSVAGSGSGCNRERMALLDTQLGQLFPPSSFEYILYQQFDPSSVTAAEKLRGFITLNRSFSLINPLPGAS